jgi:hypothetical protein
MSESQISKFPLDLTPDLASHVTHTALTLTPRSPSPTNSQRRAHRHIHMRRIAEFATYSLLSISYRLAIYPEEGARGPLPVRLAAFARTSQSHAP